MNPFIRQRSALAAAALLLTCGLSACGGDGDYCSTVQAKQAVFVDDGTGLELVTNIDTLEEIAAAAPDDIRDEWQVFLTAIEGLRDAIAEVGLQPDDFVDGAPPAIISETDRATIAAAGQRVAHSDVTQAAFGIEQHAKDVCKLQLGL